MSNGTPEQAVDLLNKEAVIEKLQAAREELQTAIAEIDTTEDRTEAINAATSLVEALSDPNAGVGDLMQRVLSLTMLVMRAGSGSEQKRQLAGGLRRFDEGISLIEISGEDDMGNVAVPTHIANKLKDLILDSNAAVGFDEKSIRTLIEGPKCCKGACKSENSAREAIPQTEARDGFADPDAIRELSKDEREPVASGVGSNYATGDHDNEDEIG